MIPVPTSQALPEIITWEGSARVLAFNQGEWKIGRLVEIVYGEPPMWSFDAGLEWLADVSHWMPLPPSPV